jgi:hypothetical protein
MKWHKAGEKLPKHNQKVIIKKYIGAKDKTAHIFKEIECLLYSGKMPATYKELKNKHGATICYWHFNDAPAVRLTASDEWAEINSPESIKC